MEEAVMTNTKLQFAKEVKNYYPELLTDGALKFLIALHQEFNKSRLQSLIEKNGRRVYQINIWAQAQANKDQKKAFIIWAIKVVRTFKIILE